jgi:type IV secretory pathway VirB10-like protein
MYKTKKISLEGNILKVIDPDGDVEFEAYIKESIEKDKDNRRKRLEITKQIQSKNTELVKSEKENERVNKQLKLALQEAEESNKAMLVSKHEAESALEDAQKAKIDAENARIEAEKARHEAEQAKNLAENDLELMQKKTQFELIGSIVKVALWVIMGVGGLVTAVYLIALFKGLNTDVIGSTWTNIVSILLTNSFSIVGTIMGVKYANQDSSKDKS